MTGVCGLVLGVIARLVSWFDPFPGKMITSGEAV